VELAGVGAAPGIAVGPIWRHTTGGSGTAQPVLDVRAAAELASAELMTLAGRVRAGGRHDDAEILEAQALMALDPLLLDAIDARAGVASEAGTDPAGSLATIVEEVAGSTAATLAAIPDETLAARAADVRDVGERIARIVTGRRIELPDRPSIAIADDLAPSVAAEIPDGVLLGVALERGSATSHAAILARGLGIPAVVGVRGLLAGADADGSSATIALDGDEGRVIFAPSDDELARLEAARQAREAAGAAARALRGKPGRTADGHRVLLLANIGRVEDVERALEAGAEGVGLFRTEFLFVGRRSAPSEEEQAAAYRAVLESFGERPVVIRLLDVGGDKPLPYLPLAPESNPFLGVRGVRLAHEHRAVLLTQLRAIARAGRGLPAAPRVMAPMVAMMADVEHFRAMVDEALVDLDRAKVGRAAHLELGIMIEVPSAALMAPELARRVDFFSIGSNDLTQYVLAMDRTHPELAAAADALHPAVLRAIRATVDGARAAGIDVAVCGELAGDPIGSLVLAGLGIDELSMDAGRLDAARFELQRRPLASLERLAAAALAATSAEEVRALAGDALTAE
jgi:multiphosphoryl transfer protein